RRVLIVQIDGLSRSVLTQALTDGTAPFLARLVRHRGWRLTPMSVGLPTSTPAFQMSAMYGVRPDIPGFHYHDKRRHADVYFPRGQDALRVEVAQAQGRRGIPRGERPGMAVARHQGRDLGVAPRAVHAGRRARPVRGRAGGLRELPRLRRVRARLRPASPTRAPRPPSHRPLDPPALARAAARPGAPLRPLRPLRPRPGAVHAVRAPLRREAHRADPLRRLPRSARGARGAGARRSRAARRARARRVSDAPRAGVLP